MRRRPVHLSRFALVAVLAAGGALAATPPAAAADGVLEIDGACVAVGCVPGDAPGFPVELVVPGSYKLTSNLVSSSTVINGLDILAPSVTLDLAGFGIFGPVFCTGTPIICNTGASNVGVGIGDVGAVVRNGVVEGFGYGVYGNGAAHFARIENVTAWSNAQNGIFLPGDGGQVVGVTAFMNGGPGIEVGQACSVRHSTTARNGLQGVKAGTDSLIVDNNIYDNGSFGVEGLGRSLYARNVISENNNDGLNDDGGSLVYGNSLTNNLLFGLSFSGGTTSGYTENVMLGNNAGAVLGGGTLLQNACNGVGC